MFSATQMRESLLSIVVFFSLLAGTGHAERSLPRRLLFAADDGVAEAAAGASALAHSQIRLRDAAQSQEPCKVSSEQRVDSCVAQRGVKMDVFGAVWMPVTPDTFCTPRLIMNAN